SSMGKLLLPSTSEKSRDKSTGPCCGRLPASTRLGPALREGQRRGAEGPAFPLPLPGPAGRLPTVERQARAEGRDQHGAHAVAPPARAGLGVDQQRVADVVPGEGDVLAAGGDVLGPEVARIARLAESGVRDRDRGVGEL